MAAHDARRRNRNGHDAGNLTDSSYQILRKDAGVGLAAEVVGEGSDMGEGKTRVYRVQMFEGALA